MSKSGQDRQNLGYTAYWTAAVRARESARADHLFVDPWAETLAGPIGMGWIAERPDDSILPMAIRTRFFDDFLLGVVAEQPVRQVILVAAGLDTRAYRLDWPAGTRLFELDQAPVLEHKSYVMKAARAQATGLRQAVPKCKRKAIPADLTADWETSLRKAGYNPAQPSVWLLEGFLFYLPVEVLTDLLGRCLRLAGPGSFVGFDIVNSLTLTSPLTKAWIEMQARAGAPWIGYLDDPQGFLSERGWQASLTPIGAPQANYGRYNLPVIPANAPGLPHFWFVTGHKV